MKTVKVIMPMGGEGSRFKGSAWDGTPKPFINVDDVPLYRHALSSIESINGELTNNNPSPIFTPETYTFEYIFIVRKNFPDNYIQEMHDYYPNATYIEIDKTTNGALETVMLAEDYICRNDYVIVIDCDLEFHSNGYLELLKKCIDNNEPLLLSFYSKDPKYSYVELTNEGKAIIVAEKEVISTHALGGCYGLGDGNTFKIFAKNYIYDYYKGKLKSKEIYLSLIYNYFLANSDKHISVYDMNFHKDVYRSYGTPNELLDNLYKNIWDK